MMEFSRVKRKLDDVYKAISELVLSVFEAFFLSGIIMSDARQNPS